MPKLDKWWTWLALNAGGLLLFFTLAKQTWIEPELSNEPGASGGEFIVWGMTALPILLLSLAGHFVFGFSAYREWVDQKNWRGSVFVAATTLCWGGAFIVDNAHHGI